MQTSLAIEFLLAVLKPITLVKNNERLISKTASILNVWVIAQWYSQLNLDFHFRCIFIDSYQTIEL